MLYEWFAQRSHNERLRFAMLTPESPDSTLTVRGRDWYVRQSIHAAFHYVLVRLDTHSAEPHLPKNHSIPPPNLK